MGPNAFDCAGLIWFIYFSLFNINLFSDGYDLSTTTKIMTNNYGKLINFEKNIRRNLDFIEKGDILFFHRQSLSDNIAKVNNYYPGHCGIYLGNKKFIHAPSTAGKVVISNFDNNLYWFEILIGSKNLVSDQILLNLKKI